jgi:uncharacterized BrkB/YihY/UPF0761 family membrane protein
MNKKLPIFISVVALIVSLIYLWLPNVASNRAPSTPTIVHPEPTISPEVKYE